MPKLRHKCMFLYDAAGRHECRSAFHAFLRFSVKTFERTIPMMRNKRNKINAKPCPLGSASRYNLCESKSVRFLPTATTAKDIYRAAAAVTREFCQTGCFVFFKQDYVTFYQRVCLLVNITIDDN